jgi:hypothetical protein
MNTPQSNLLRLGKVCLVAVAFLLLGGTVNAQSAEPSKGQGEKQKPVRTDKNAHYNTSAKAPVTVRKPAASGSASEMSKTENMAATAIQPVAAEQKRTATKEQSISKEKQNPTNKQVSADNPPAVSLKATSDAAQEAASNEKSLAIKKQKFAAALRSRGYSEAEISKLVNAKFSEPKQVQSK